MPRDNKSLFHIKLKDGGTAVDKVFVNGIDISDCIFIDGFSFLYDAEYMTCSFKATACCSIDGKSNGAVFKDRFEDIELPF